MSDFKPQFRELDGQPVALTCRRCGKPAGELRPITDGDKLRWRIGVNHLAGRICGRRGNEDFVCS